MQRRSRDWREGLSEELKKDKYKRTELFLGFMEEGYTWREALQSIVKIIGVNEYTQLMGGEMKPSNLLNQLRPGHNFNLNTLEKITAPLAIEMTFKTPDGDDPKTA